MERADNRVVSMGMRVFESNGKLSWQEVSALPHTGELKDWRGAHLASAFEWCFVKDTERLWFSARLPGGSFYDQTHCVGDFVEGLWQQDVAEFFVKDSSGRYQEFNVSPSGAWWTTLLSSYRRRAAVQPKISNPEIHTQVLQGRWFAVIGVALADVGVQCNTQTLIHVSGIHGSPHQTFMSSKPQPHISPDFHEPNCFEAIEFEQLL